MGKNYSNASMLIIFGANKMGYYPFYTGTQKIYVRHMREKRNTNGKEIF